VSRKIRGSRRRVQRGGNGVDVATNSSQGSIGATIDNYKKSTEAAVSGAASDVKNKLSNWFATPWLSDTWGKFWDKDKDRVVTPDNSVLNPLLPENAQVPTPAPIPVTPSQVPTPASTPVTPSQASGQEGGKRRRRPQTHIRLNRKYISRKMNNIVDIFRKQLTCKNKGKNKKSRRHYRGGAYGNYPGAVGNINVPMPSRP